MEPVSRATLDNLFNFINYTLKDPDGRGCFPSPVGHSSPLLDFFMLRFVSGDAQGPQEKPVVVADVRRGAVVLGTAGLDQHVGLRRPDLSGEADVASSETSILKPCSCAFR